MDLTALSKDELLKIQEKVKTLLNTTEQEPLKNCVHCYSTDLVKNGNARGKQRYKCRACKKTFSQVFNSIRHYSHKDEATWARYIELMFQRKSISKIADEMGISSKTAFYMRHKILEALKMEQEEQTQLHGIIEADEKYFRLSYKGQKKNFPKKRWPRKRGKSTKFGGSGQKRGLSKNQVCVLTAIDRTNYNTYMEPVCLATIKQEDLEGGFLTQVNWSDSFLLTDGHTAYGNFATEHSIVHTPVDSYFPSKGSKHITTINSVHKQLKDFMAPFNGVATKYLDNYMAFFQYRNSSEDMANKEGWVTWDELRGRQMNLK